MCVCTRVCACNHVSGKEREKLVFSTTNPQLSELLSASGEISHLYRQKINGIMQTHRDLYKWMHILKFLSTKAVTWTRMCVKSKGIRPVTKSHTMQPYFCLYVPTVTVITVTLINSNLTCMNYDNPCQAYRFFSVLLLLGHENKTATKELFLPWIHRHGY